MEVSVPPKVTDLSLLSQQELCGEVVKSLWPHKLAVDWLESRQEGIPVVNLVSWSSMVAVDSLVLHIGDKLDRIVVDQSALCQVVEDLQQMLRIMMKM